MYDVAIIGAGITGGMLARELSKYRLSVCVLEKENDVSCGASKANSGIIHGGFDPEPGTLKARLNVSGVPMLYKAAAELNVSVKNNGSLVVAFSVEEEQHLQKLYDRGITNGVDKMKLISGYEARIIEPELSIDVTKALLISSAGIVCPYELTIASIGNAMDNGVDLKCNFTVTEINKSEYFTVKSETGELIESKYLVNCAGVYADKIAQLLDDKFYDIIPKAGEYMLLDKVESTKAHHTIFQVPTNAGKGILVSPTVHDNLLTGPTASIVADPEFTDTTPDGLKIVEKLASKSVPTINFRQVITSFSGVRASTKGGDFIIEASKKVEGFIHAAAIDSPGLSCCVAIAKEIVGILEDAGLKLENYHEFNGHRNDPHIFSKMNDPEKAEFINKNPSYDKIVCRCETITEGEIIDAIHRNPKPSDVDGVKRRTRAGMGRCQGGFCLPYVMKLLAKENNTDMNSITKKGNNSTYTDGVL